MAKARHIITGQEWSTDDPVSEASEPMYKSFDEFVANIPEAMIRKWCQSKTTTANRTRLMSGEPQNKVTAQQIMDILFAARGRCCYCGSLCVEKAPTIDGKLAPWAHVGRRIGSLTHRVSRVDAGDNEPNNLAWCCNWCNTWASERRVGATDHGGIQEPDVYQLTDEIAEQLERIFSPEGFEGTAEQYVWLSENYGVTEDDDLLFMTICDYYLEDLKKLDEWAVESIETNRLFLEDEQEVLTYLTEFLRKCKSKTMVYPWSNV